MSLLFPDGQMTQFAERRPGRGGPSWMRWLTPSEPTDHEGWVRVYIGVVETVSRTGRRGPWDKALSPIDGVAELTDLRTGALDEAVLEVTLRSKDLAQVERAWLGEQG